MANFVAALKDEIRRLARKEVKAHVAKPKQATARYRREIAALKRDIGALRRKLNFLESQERRRIGAPKVADDSASNVRFSARSVKSQRRRLGLSAADYGRLIGVSGLTVYHWEHGVARPRARRLVALAAIRGIGKRKALAQLKLLNGKAH